MPYGFSYGTSGFENFQYTGKQLDASSGLYYYGYRYYDSQSGRFTSPDVLPANPKNPQSINQYVYAFNNPMMHIDPNGAGPRWYEAWCTGGTSTFDMSYSGAANYYNGRGSAGGQTVVVVVVVVVIVVVTVVTSTSSSSTSTDISMSSANEAINGQGAAWEFNEPVEDSSSMSSTNRAINGPGTWSDFTRSPTPGSKTARDIALIERGVDEYGAGMVGVYLAGCGLSPQYYRGHPDAYASRKAYMYSGGAGVFDRAWDDSWNGATGLWGDIWSGDAAAYFGWKG